MPKMQTKLKFSIKYVQKLRKYSFVVVVFFFFHKFLVLRKNITFFLLYIFKKNIPSYTIYKSITQTVITIANGKQQSRSFKCVYVYIRWDQKIRIMQNNLVCKKKKQQHVCTTIYIFERSNSKNGAVSTIRKRFAIRQKIWFKFDAQLQKCQRFKKRCQAAKNSWCSMSSWGKI